jgi:cell division initiation protein
MTITPVELRNFQFARKMRGYDPIDVDAVIDEAATEIENLIAAKSKLEDEIRKLQDRLKTFEGIEQSLRQALVTAEEAARQQQEAASREVELKLKEAEIEAERRVTQSMAEIERARMELAHLRRQKSVFLAEMRALIESHLHLLGDSAAVSKNEQLTTADETVVAGTESDTQVEYGPHEENQ